MSSTHPSISLPFISLHFLLSTHMVLCNACFAKWEYVHNNFVQNARFANWEYVNNHFVIVSCDCVWFKLQFQPYQGLHSLNGTCRLLAWSCLCLLWDFLQCLLWDFLQESQCSISCLFRHFVDKKKLKIMYFKKFK